MKRIMIVDENQVVGYTGGAEHIICAFANEFTDRGYFVSIVCMNKEDGRPWYPLNRKVDFINLAQNEKGNPFKGIYWQWLRIKRELLRAVGGKTLSIFGKQRKDPKKKYQYDIFSRRLSVAFINWRPEMIISLDAESAYLSFQAMSRVQLDIPVISMCHSHPDECKEMSTLLLDAWKRCACVQVLQKGFIPMIQSLGVRNVIAIPNIVKQFSEQYIKDREQYLKYAKQHQIITVGRLEGNGKRQHILIKAFALLADKYPDWSVHIYGSSDNRRYVKKLKKLIGNFKLQDRVFLDGVTDDLPTVFRKSDIFAFPSRREGFGLAVCEAMSAGMSVVAFKECYPTNEIIQDGKTGILVDNNIEDFSKALEVLMKDNQKRIILGKSAHIEMKKYQAKCIWEKWYQILNKVYKKE